MTRHTIRLFVYLSTALIADLTSLFSQTSPPILLPGQEVDVFVRDGKWYPAKIIEITPDGRPRVSYDGYGPESYEVVDPRTLRPRMKPSATSEPSPQMFLPGQKVEVFAKNKWFKATVVQVYENQIEVQYDGYTYREWVAPDPRWIRAETSGQNIQSSDSSALQITPPPPAPGAVPIAPTISSPPVPSIGSAITTPTGQLPPEGLFLMERELANFRERRIFLIDKSGMVFENPTGGPQPFDPNAFRSVNPTRVGRARMGRGEMEIIWEGGRLPAASSFEVTPDGFNWDRASFRKLSPTPLEKLVGIYQAGRSEPVRTSDGWTMGSTGMRIEIRSDGTCSRINADGVLTGEGTFSIDGYTLILDNNGIKTRHFAVRYTSADGSEEGLYFDGDFLRLLP